MKCEYRFTHFPKVEVKQKCKTDVNIHVKCHDENENGETAAFRAVNNANQPIEFANQFYKVLFQKEQFDIGDIYNANSSTFVPRQSGVYYVAGTVTFIADNQTIPYRVRVEIRVNGTTVAADNDFFNFIDQSFVYVNAINVSTVLNLQAGDLVEVFLTSTTPGFVDQDNPGFSTRFEASKFF